MRSPNFPYPNEKNFQFSIADMDVHEEHISNETVCKLYRHHAKSPTGGMCPTVRMWFESEARLRWNNVNQYHDSHFDGYKLTTVLFPAIVYV